MKVIIENMFFGWHENAPETFIKLINSLVVAKDETEVRNVMQHFAVVFSLHLLSVLR